MNNRRLFSIFVIAIITTLFTGNIYSQENMQRSILGAGMLIGLNETTLEQENVTDGDLQFVNTNREALIRSLDDIIRLYQSPFDNNAMKAIRERVQNFDVFSTQMINRHKANFFYKTYHQMKQSLAMTFGSRRGEQNNFYAESTCDSALLDFAYHFGKGWRHAMNNNLSGLKTARSGMNLAIKVGLDCAERLGCSFPTKSFLDSLNLNQLKTGEEFQAVAIRLNGLRGNTTGLRGNVRVPSTAGIAVTNTGTLPDTVLGKWGKGETVVTQEGNQYVIQASWPTFNGTLGSFSTAKSYHNQLKTEVFKGKYYARNRNLATNQTQNFWVEAYWELMNFTDDQGNLIRQVLRAHYFDTENNSWRAPAFHRKIEDLQ